MHNYSWRRPVLFLLGGFLFSILASCGKGFKEDVPQQEEEWEGHYYTFFKPLNQRFGRFNGWTRISITENQFWVRIKLEGKKTKNMHAQYLHAQGRCPDMQDDTNRDGYLDFMEVYRVAGPILIPFDSNITSQLKGIHEFPSMKLFPNYYYSEASHYGRMLEDLRRPDVIKDDMMTKLINGEGLDLHRRVVLIYGIDESYSLPSTVRTIPGYPPQATIPIACGELREGNPSGP